jgi:hypothetical protein
LVMVMNFSLCFSNLQRHSALYTWRSSSICSFSLLLKLVSKSWEEFLSLSVSNLCCNIIPLNLRSNSSFGSVSWASSVLTGWDRELKTELDTNWHRGFLLDLLRSRGCCLVRGTFSLL